MKKLLLIVLVCLPSVLPATTPAGDEFTRLRLDYAKPAAAELTWVANSERQALVALYATDKQKFVAAGVAWLKKCPVDAKVQLMMGSAWSALGRPREAIAYRYFFYGLLQSIVGDRDGLSKATAYKVISVDEEYTVCNFLGADVASQRLEGSMDVLTVQLDGQTKELYFDATIPLESMQRRLTK